MSTSLRTIISRVQRIRSNINWHQRYSGLGAGLRAYVKELKLVDCFIESVFM